MIVYRFDFEYLSLPYFLYIEFKQLPSENTLRWITKKVQSHHRELCSPSEIISCNRHGLRIIPYRTFKDICSGHLADSARQIPLPFEDEVPF